MAWLNKLQWKSWLSRTHPYRTGRMWTRNTEPPAGRESLPPTGDPAGASVASTDPAILPPDPTNVQWQPPALTLPIWPPARMVISPTRRTLVAIEGDPTEHTTASGLHELWDANFKKIFADEQDLKNGMYQQFLEATGRSRVQFDQLQNLALQAMQNAIESANMLSKQAIAHRDIAIENEWGTPERATEVAAAKVASDTANG